MDGQYVFEKNIYVFEQLIQHISNIIDIIYRLEE